MMGYLPPLPPVKVLECKRQLSVEQLQRLEKDWQRMYEYQPAPTPWTSRDWDRLKGIVGTAALLAFYLRDWIWGLMA